MRPTSQNLFSVHMCMRCMCVVSVWEFAVCVQGSVRRLEKEEGALIPHFPPYQRTHASRCAGVEGRRLLRGVCWGSGPKSSACRVLSPAKPATPRAHPGDNNDIFSIAEEGSCRTIEAECARATRRLQTVFSASSQFQIVRCDFEEDF